MKGFWHCLSIALDVVLVVGTLALIISGQGAFMDYFILLAFAIEIPAMILHHRRNAQRKRDAENRKKEEDSPS